MKKIAYNNVDILLKELIVFFSILLFLLFSATAVLSNDFFHKVIITDGRAVIINGDKETGVGIMEMEEGLDTGKVLFEESIKPRIV